MITKTKKPVHQIRMSPIQVSIWENQNEKDGSVFHNVTWTRNYKDGDEFKHSNSVSKNNISTLIAALGVAKEWLEKQ